MAGTKRKDSKEREKDKMIPRTGLEITVWR